MGEQNGTPSKRILLVVEYDGGGLFGSQRQREEPTVQSLLEDAIHKVTGTRNAVTFSGRTDSGVHSSGMLATFETDSTISIERFPPALSAHLPPEVAVVSARRVPEDFHPRKLARRKLYRYRILNRAIRSPFEQDRAWHVSAPLDLALMRRAARHLPGTKDFRAFATEAHKKENTVRTITAVRIRREGDIIEVDVDGEGFLYNMVRAIAGSLVEVGRGKETPEWLLAVIESRDRSKAGPTAPPQGLTLVRVLW